MGNIATRPRLVHTDCAVRTAAFSYCFLTTGAWALLALQFLAYPHLAPGADALARVHPDDAVAARTDVLGQPQKALRNALQPPEFYDELYAAVQREGYWSGTT